MCYPGIFSCFSSKRPEKRKARASTSTTSSTERDLPNPPHGQDHYSLPTLAASQLSSHSPRPNYHQHHNINNNSHSPQQLQPQQPHLSLLQPPPPAMPRSGVRKKSSKAGGAKGYADNPPCARNHQALTFPPPQPVALDASPGAHVLGFFWIGPPFSLWLSFLRFLISLFPVFTRSRTELHFTQQFGR